MESQFPAQSLLEKQPVSRRDFATYFFWLPGIFFQASSYGGSDVFFLSNKESLATPPGSWPIWVSWVKLGVFSKLKKPSGISSTTMGFFVFFGGWVLVKLLPDPSKTVDINYFSEALSSHDG